MPGLRAMRSSAFAARQYGRLEGTRKEPASPAASFYLCYSSSLLSPPMSQVTKSCTLPDELVRFAEAEVRAGRYGSVDEVIQTALHRLRHHDIIIDEDDAPELVAALEPALEDIRQGRYEEGSAKDLMARVRADIGL